MERWDAQTRNIKRLFTTLSQMVGAFALTPFFPFYLFIYLFILTFPANELATLEGAVLDWQLAINISNIENKID